MQSDVDPSAPAWAYRAPKRPDDHPSQLYYRAQRWNHIARPGDSLDYPQLTLFRFDCDADAKLTVKVECALVEALLSVADLTSLRDALNDALQDIAAYEADRERQESFDAISAELREADERGESPGVLYAHPDVHYVPPGQCTAKVHELEAAGAKRYMVLSIDPAAGADDARSTRHFPELCK